MYSADSIVNALKANEELMCEGIDKLGCPSSHNGCNGKPEECEICINQSCKQQVSIHTNYQKLAVLFFKFMVSLNNHGGFIRKDDSALKSLISRKFIDKEMLRPVE